MVYFRLCIGTDVALHKIRDELHLHMNSGKTNSYVLSPSKHIYRSYSAEQIISKLQEAMNVVHYGFIEKFICDLGERYNIREIAYDRWNATMMVQQLEDDGFVMVPFGQGFKDMSPPTKELMRIVLERNLNHGGHPVLRWNMDNAFVRTDPAGNLKIDKEKSTEKVDGAVALVMALDRAMKNQGGSGSVYDERGLPYI